MAHRLPIAAERPCWSSWSCRRFGIFVSVPMGFNSRSLSLKLDVGIRFCVGVRSLVLVPAVGVTVASSPSGSALCDAPFSTLWV